MPTALVTGSPERVPEIAIALKSAGFDILAAGAGAGPPAARCGGLKVNWSAADVPDVPPSVVAVTWTVPEAWAGAVARSFPAGRSGPCPGPAAQALQGCLRLPRQACGRFSAGQRFQDRARDSRCPRQVDSLPGGPEAAVLVGVAKAGDLGVLVLADPNEDRMRVGVEGLARARIGQENGARAARIWRRLAVCSRLLRVIA